MTLKTEISQDNFERLLNWLDSDREKAGRKYETIRARLIKILFTRGCHLAEELADEAIDRVARKADVLFGSYEGEPALYFYAVAKKVFLEYSRTPKNEELPAVIAHQEEEKTDENTESYFKCLEKCLQIVAPEQRDFIIRYYREEKQAKIEERKRLEKELGVTSENLRIRAFRMRKNLQKCVSSCVENGRL